MSKPAQGSPPNTTPSAVNWGTPAKRDLVERAISDGIKDPAKIIEWAGNYNVVLTLDEIDSLKKEISGH